MDAKTKIAIGDPALFRQQCYVNGGWTDAKDGATLDVNNPATGEIIGASPPSARRRPAPPSRRPTQRGPGGAHVRRRNAPT